MLSHSLLSILITATTLGGTVSLAVGQSTMKDSPKRILLRAKDLPKPYSTPNAENGGQVVARPAGAELKLPPGFKAEVFAADFETPRWISIAPNGDVFVAEAGASCITVLRPDSNGKPTQREVFVEEIKRPFGMVFWKDWLYVGTPGEILRFRYKDGQMKADGKPEAIVTGLPTDGHWTRSLTLNPRTGKMYVSIGSSKDIGEESEPRRATVCEFNLDGSGFRVFATGLRNAVGLSCNPKTGVLWATVQERDKLGDDLVPDYMTSVKESGFYGWPWYYIGANHDPRMAEKPELAKKSLVPDVLFTSHSSAMCLTFYTGEQFPKQYRGDAFVALHGSGNRAKRTGYSIVRVPFKNGKPNGGYEEFVTGWMMGEDDKRVWGRPVGLTQAKDGSLLMVDDGANKVWRIYYTK